MADDIYYAVRLYRYKQTLMSGSAWKETWLQLKLDGIIIWYNNKRCAETRGKVDFNKIAAHVKIGGVAKLKLQTVCPKQLPFQYSETCCLMAIPAEDPTKLSGTARRRSLDQRKWHWFCFKSQNDMLTTLRQFSRYVGYEREFDEYFHIKPERNYGNYARYGVPMSGGLESGNDNEDWGEVWDRFLTDIAPYRYLRRRSNAGRKYVSSIEDRISVVTDGPEVEVVARDEENVTVEDDYAIPMKISVIRYDESGLFEYEHEDVEAIVVLETVITEPEVVEAEQQTNVVEEIDVRVISIAESGLFDDWHQVQMVEEDDEDFVDGDEDEEVEASGNDSWEEITTKVFTTTYTTIVYDSLPYEIEKIHAKFSDVSTHHWSDSGLDDSCELLSSPSTSPAVSCSSDNTVVIMEDGNGELLL